MAPKAPILVRLKNTWNFPLKPTPKRFIPVNNQIVNREIKNVVKRLNGLPEVISYIAFKYSVKTNATATIDAVSDTKNMAQPRINATYGP